jgi:hypothetical protein
MVEAVSMSRSAAAPTPLSNRIRAVFTPPLGYRLDLIVLFLSSFCFLVAFIRWFDNSQAITSNGVFKALTIRSWMADPANAALDASNYLYYPAMALLCRLLVMAWELSNQRIKATRKQNEERNRTIRSRR